MITFRVWAPKANAVEVEVGGKRVPTTRQEGDWWTADIAWAEVGDSYAFVVDGGEPLPDPRSPWQPHGVHGPSCLVDHDAFQWTDKGWEPPPLSSAIIYELHIGTFTPEGTFDAAIQRLDHLVDLGVTHVELMPVNQFPSVRGWGYDGVQLYAPHHAYGGSHGLKRLVDACHSRGLAVILDVVYNHLGPEGNYLPRFGPYLTDRYRTPWGPAVNLDGPYNHEVRRFLIDNALMWLRDYHIDGLRLDAVHAILDTSAVHFLEQLATEVDALEARLGRRLVLIAESDLNDPRIIRSPEIGGFGLDAQWSDDFHHALHAILTTEKTGYYADFGSLGDLASALQHAFVYQGQFSAYRRRHHGRPTTGLSGDHFVVCAQNHDQVGNRAGGERLSHLISADRLKVVAAVLLSSPFIPLLFQGEEWGASTPFQFFTDFQDPALGDAVGEGRRREFAAFGSAPAEVPDPQAQETFLRSKLQWSEISREPHTGLLRWYKELIHLRRTFAIFRDGRLDRVQVDFSPGHQWLVVERLPGILACNFSEQPEKLLLEHGGSFRQLAASRPDIRLEGRVVELPPESAAIFMAGEQSPG